MSDCCDKHACNAAASSVAPLPASTTAGALTVRYRIMQMDCPTEEALIRGKLNAMAGVSSLEFNLIQRVLTVHHTLSSLNSIEVAIADLGFRADAIDERGMAGSAKADPLAAPTASTQFGWPLILSGVAAFAAEMVELRYPEWHWLVGALALAAIASGGLTTYRKGWIALKHKTLNINALMSIAVTGALLIGQWPEAAMVMFLFALAEVIEARSVDHARQSIRALMNLTPEKATVLTNGRWESVGINTIAVGAIVRVRPGERIALDGEISQGRSTVNQASITGESLPVDKGPGDTVFAGTLNEAGEMEYRVTSAAGQSTLARIIHAVEEAQGARAPTQRFVDKFASVYTPVVFVMALAVATLAPLLLGGSWLEWIYRSLVLLVIACPCALVISTPVTIVSGLSAAARRGILIKGGAFLETGRHLQVVALDKTGTLTQGRPEQTDMEFIGDGDHHRLHSLALSLAMRSDHPVSQALVRAAPDTLAPCDITHFTALPGRGIRGEWEGERLHLGNHRLIEELGLCSPVLEQRLDALERQGKTVIMLTNPTRVLALFAMADTLKPGSITAIQHLHSLGVKTVMLSGDNAHTAQAIAQHVGIDAVYSNQLPEDKFNTITALINQGNVVGMVGDGINDAPALARANIGFAMGAAGTDTAIETADVALMDDDLRKIPVFVQLSRQTAAILKQNICIALGIKAAFLALALAGDATLWMAVFADMGTSLLVVANGLRLLKPHERR